MKSSRRKKDKDKETQIIIVPSDGHGEIANALKEKNSWMNTYQAAQGANIIEKQLAEHIRNGADPAAFYPATDESPAKIVVILTEPNND